MTAPLDQPGGGQPRAIVGGVRLWAGGAATTLVVALIALVGVLLSRVVGVPGLAGDETGTLATALLASYAVMWAGTTLLLTGGLHLLLLFVRRPLQRFAWVASALVLLAEGEPFRTAGGASSRRPRAGTQPGPTPAPVRPARAVPAGSRSGRRGRRSPGSPRSRALRRSRPAGGRRSPPPWRSR